MKTISLALTLIVFGSVFVCHELLAQSIYDTPQGVPQASDSLKKPRIRTPVEMQRGVQLGIGQDHMRFGISLEQKSLDSHRRYRIAIDRLSRQGCNECRVLHSNNFSVSVDRVRPSSKQILRLDSFRFAGFGLSVDNRLDLFEDAAVTRKIGVNLTAGFGLKVKGRLSLETAIQSFHFLNRDARVSVPLAMTVSF